MCCVNISDFTLIEQRHLPSRIVCTLLAQRSGVPGRHWLSSARRAGDVSLVYSYLGKRGEKCTDLKSVS